MRTLNLNSLFRGTNKLPEHMLVKAYAMLDTPIHNEINTFLLKNISPEGGFVNREGKPDLYYSLFGFFILRALGMVKEQKAISDFIRKATPDIKPPSPDFFAVTILAAALLPNDQMTAVLKSKLKHFMFSASRPGDYQIFMGMLAFFYLKDYISLSRLVLFQKNKASDTKEHPSSILAASIILAKLRGKSTIDFERELMNFYSKPGGFKALKNAPLPDLLSTAVSLYALHFCDADIRLIRPDCIEFVEQLYKDGGFCATVLDDETDVEYLFYGLLALGSLK